MRKMYAVICAALLLACGFIIASAATADAQCGGGGTGPTYVLDAPDFGTACDVANLVSKNTGVNMVVGPCNPLDPMCIRAHLTDPIPCGNVGCAQWDADACEVYISQQMQLFVGYRIEAYEFNSLGHEVIHCILRSPWHAINERDIMYSATHYSDPEKRITRETMEQFSVRFVTKKGKPSVNRGQSALQLSQ